MKKIPFNLEDARNGRDIYVDGKKCESRRFSFIGLDSNNDIIVEDDCGRLRRFSQESAYHLPKTVTKYVNLYYNYTFHVPLYQYKEFDSYEDAVNNKFGDSENIKYLKTVDIDIEIEEDY